MLPRFSAEIIASRLSSVALLVAMLLPAVAAAQTTGEDVPFESVVDSSSYLGQTPLRVWHRTRGFGEETSETALGTHWATPLQMGLAFVDGNLRIGNADTDFSVNFGVGFRWRNDDFFTDSPRIFGLSVWYDGEDTQLDNYFNQIGVSFERLGPLVDLRLNANIPLEDIKQSDDVTLTGDPVFSGNFLSQSTIINSDVALRVVDFEVAPRLFNLNAWAYAGGYQMDGEGVSELGRKGGVRGYLLNDLALDVGVQDDDQFGTNTVVQIIWTPGRVSADPSNWTHNIDDRMREQVYRNPYVAVHQIQTAGTAALTDATGNLIRIVHVDSSAPAGGDGSFENPLNNLDEIDNNSTVGDIILAHAESSFTGQSTTLQDAQRFLGEGDNVEHTVFTQELGTIDLPETAPGALAGNRPVINNHSGAAAVVLMGGNDSVEDLAGMEVSNFDIVGGTRAVQSPNGVGSVNINNLNVSNTTGNAILLTALQETLEDNTTRSRFQVNIDDVTFTNVGTAGGVDEADILLNGDTTNTNITESIAISDYTSDDGHGVGIYLQNTKRATTLTDIDWDGGTTGVGAVRIENAIAQTSVTANGTNVITGGLAATPGAGYAINLVNSAGTHTFNETTVTNTGGDSVVVTGGTASLQFRGIINQANDASVLNVTDHMTGGTLNFVRAASAAAGTNVINATNGDGLQFTDADGTYTFGDIVKLNGGTAGIDVVAGDDATNGSQGRFTFSNVDIDYNDATVGAAAVTVTDSTPVNFNLAGDIDVTGGRPIAFTGNNGGDFAITATIDGDDEGILLDNDGGTYAFSAAIDMNTNVNDAIEITNNSGGTNNFTGAVTIATTDGDGIVLTGNTAGTTSFNNLNIDSTGTGVGILANASAAHTLTVSGAANTIETESGAALNLNQLTIGTSGVNFSSVTVDADASGGALNGIVLSNLTGGAVNVGTAGGSGGSGGEINTTGDAVLISNAANVSLNNMNIVSTGGNGVEYNRTTTQSITTRFTLLGNNISTGAAGAEAILMNIDGSNQANITLSSNTVSSAANGNEAILVNTTGSGVKDVRFLANAGNTFTANSTDPAANFQLAGSGSFNATVTNNVFTNGAAAGRAFVMSGNGAATAVRLNLDLNTGIDLNAAPEAFLLDQNAGTFTVLNLSSVDSRNQPGGVETQGTITNDAGPIPQPQ